VTAPTSSSPLPISSIHKCGSLYLLKHVTIWGIEVWLHLFLFLSVDGSEWLASWPFRFTWRNGPALPFNGGWWAPERVLGALENRGIYFHCQESTYDPSAVQPVVQSLSRWCVTANACIASSELEFEVDPRVLASRSCNQNVVESSIRYSSHYLGTWCIQHYYRWYAHLGCQ
jgi:hypothetical protein